MLARHTTIIEAAFVVFGRYGYKRTTMNDIAVEAGVARQTLYNAFANKETILRAIIRHMTDDTVAAIEAQMDSEGGLGDAIDVLFDHTARAPYETIKSTPHAEELIEGIHAAAAEELHISCERKIEATAKLFSRFEPVASAGVTADQIARLTVASALLYPKQAQSHEELETLLATLKALVLNAFDLAKA